jgi:hypothetical protein
VEDPDVLRRRLKLGREEFCQRLLTMLILEAEYPRWNTVGQPAPRGLSFLRSLDEASFGSSDLADDSAFVDEFDLPARHAGEPGCAPDWAVLTHERVWVIELKTEVASHRRGQLPAYFELARHHHPGHRVDLTYLTPPMPLRGVSVPDGSRLAHLTWDDVMPLVRATWDDRTGVVARCVDALEVALADMGTPWTDWRQKRIEDPLAAGKDQARLTSRDGRQRAVDHEFTSLEELQETRLALRDELVDEASDVQPWIWRAETSGGHPLTPTGERVGYELRLSRTTGPS